MIISIIDGTNIDDAEVQRVVRAVNRQLAEDFKRHWHRDVQLRLEGWTGEKPDPANPVDMRGDAVLYLWDEADVAGALGYHDNTAAGVPYGFVFIKLSTELGLDWSVTLSHEALELAMDPDVNLLAQGPHPDPKEKGRIVYHWYELCDAVQDSTYEIDDVKVANFVLPPYFTTGDQHKNHNDFMGTQIRSFGVGPGGYVGFFDPETQQHETYVDPGDEKAKRRQKIKQAFRDVTRTGRHLSGSDSEWEGLAQCDAITFQLEHEPTLATARELVGRILGASWRVAPVRGSKDEFDAIHPSKGRAKFSKAWELTHRLAAEPGVLRAEPSLSFPVPGTSDHAAPTDRRLSSIFSGPHLPGTQRARWGLELCRVPGAWNLFKTREPGKGVIVGHPDSGYRPHDEMDQDRVRRDLDFDFLDDDLDASSPKGNHGLSTASVIMSGARAAGDQLAGAALFAEIVPLRVTQPVGLVPAPVLFVSGMRRLRDAVDYATRANCGVISMSLGSPFDSDSLHAAINRARDAGLIVLAAAGNEVRFVTYPARWPEVIAVGGCNIERKPWFGSCRGAAVDITAPAESVWRAFHTDDGKPAVGRSAGTSYAVALTAGVAALWLAYHGHHKLKKRYGARGVQDVFSQLMRQTAQSNHQLPAGKFGAGILDAEALLSAPLPNKAPEPVRATRATRNTDLEELVGVRGEAMDPGFVKEIEAAAALRETAIALQPARPEASPIPPIALSRNLSPQLRAQCLTIGAGRRRVRDDSSSDAPSTRTSEAKGLRGTRQAKKKVSKRASRSKARG